MPAGQSVQTEAEVEEENLPVGQAVQEVEAEEEKRPVGQAVQVEEEEEAVAEEEVPAGHGVHVAVESAAA